MQLRAGARAGRSAKHAPIRAACCGRSRASPSARSSASGAAHLPRSCHAGLRASGVARWLVALHCCCGSLWCLCARGESGGVSRISVCICARGESGGVSRISVCARRVRWRLSYQCVSLCGESGRECVRCVCGARWLVALHRAVSSLWNRGENVSGGAVLDIQRCVSTHRINFTEYHGSSAAGSATLPVPMSIGVCHTSSLFRDARSPKGGTAPRSPTDRCHRSCPREVTRSVCICSRPCAYSG